MINVIPNPIINQHIQEVPLLEGTKERTNSLRMLKKDKQTLALQAAPSTDSVWSSDSAEEPNIYNVTSTDFANQLTILEHNLFCSIPSTDNLYKGI